MAEPRREPKGAENVEPPVETVPDFRAAASARYGAALVSDAPLDLLGTIARTENEREEGPRPNVVRAIQRRRDEVEAAGTHSVEELMQYAQPRWRTVPAIVRAAFLEAGVTRATLEVADELVPQFMNREA